MFICAYSKMYIIEDPCSESTNKNQANRKLSLFDDTELSLIMNDGISSSSSNGGGSDFIVTKSREEEGPSGDDYF